MITDKVINSIWFGDTVTSENGVWRLYSIFNNLRGWGEINLLIHTLPKHSERGGSHFSSVKVCVNSKSGKGD